MLEYVERKGTASNKWDGLTETFGADGLLPLWVADMDFRVDSHITDALSDYMKTGVFGYYKIPDSYYDSFIEWENTEHGLSVEREWIRYSPGVVCGFNFALQVLTEPGDSVIIQQPVYYPFSSLIRHNGRKVVSSDLVRDAEGHYSMDYDDFEQKVIRHDVKLFILCNPHNPVGRVWTKEELQRIGRICAAHGVIVFSDEIHFDFVWEGEHNVFQEIDPAFREFTVTATSPSKTFNLAGLQQSNIFIPNISLKRRFTEEINRTGYDEPTIFGIAAAQAVYENGDTWYESMKAYVEKNICFADEFVREHLPGVSMKKPEGTYLIWLDFSGTGMTTAELDDMIIQKAKLWLDSGAIFGKAGEGFQRINTACPQSILREALERLEDVL